MFRLMGQAEKSIARLAIVACREDNSAVIIFY